MSVVFGDFVFKISAPVQNAIDNLKRWDSASQNTAKAQKTVAKEETASLDERGKSWGGFFGIVSAGFLSITAVVMKYSPHVNAHLTRIGISMRMLGRTIGKTWGPYFKILADVLRATAKFWKDMGKGSKGMTDLEKETPADGIAGMLGLDKGQAADLNRNIFTLVNTFLLFGGVLAGLVVGGGLLSAALGALGLGGGFASLGAIATPILSTLAASFWPILLILALVGVFLIGFADAWDTNFLNIRGYVDLFVKGMEDTWNGLAEFLGGLWDVIIGLFTGDTEKFLGGIDSMLSGTFNFFYGVGEMAIGFLAVIGVVVIQLVANILTVIWECILKVGEFFGGLWDTIIKVWDGIVDSVFKIGKEVLRTLEDTFGGLVDAGLKFGTDMLNSIGETIDGIGKMFGDLAHDAIGWGEDFIKNVVSGIVGMGTWVTDEVGKLFDNTIGSVFSFDIKTNDDKAKRWGSDMIDNFAQGVKQGSRTVVNQKVFQNLTINNLVSSEGLDIYGLANLAGNALNENLKEQKGLGSQYY